MKNIRKSDKVIIDDAQKAEFAAELVIVNSLKAKRSAELLIANVEKAKCAVRY